MEKSAAFMAMETFLANVGQTSSTEEDKDSRNDSLNDKDHKGKEKEGSSSSSSSPSSSPGRRNPLKPKAHKYKYADLCKKKARPPPPQILKLYKWLDDFFFPCVFLQNVVSETPTKAFSPPKLIIQWSVVFRA